MKLAVLVAWILSKGGSTLAEAPDVHSVEIQDPYVVVRSAGISLRYFGPLQPSPVAAEGLREFVYRIPIHPQPETGRHARVPMEVIGAFVNGLPIYNHFEALSFNGGNLWHYDAVAYNDDGTLTSGGHPRLGLTHPAAPGMLEQLVKDNSRHSPLIGFALDGYPVYGPWAYGNEGLRRMRSSYRLRHIRRRQTWPDGTQLTPAQYGPEVGASDPAGTFAEDYEYVSGAGDLDECNGRFTKTPEYPEGTYAYFLTTDADGRLAFPYLIGPRFHGRVEGAAERRNWLAIAQRRLELSADATPIQAGKPVRFRLTAKDAHGESIREFEYVHERPIHFLVASDDLAEFDHIHPELAPDDSYQVTHTFAHGGRYRIWADYSLPGEAPYVDEFDLRVAGPARASRKLAASRGLEAEAGSLRVRLAPSQPLRAGADIPVTLKLAGSIQTLEPYLGAWAHVIVIGKDPRTFQHAHPVETATVLTPVHTHAAAGPPPDEIHIVASFPSPGLYKLWAQFQQGGKVLTVPFVLSVGPAVRGSGAPATIPQNAVRVQVTRHGFDPARVIIPAGTPLTLAFTREAAPNCGAEIVFPALSIRQALPLGQTVLVQLPAQAAGEIGFSCGMGMYRGMLVAR